MKRISLSVIVDAIEETTDGWEQFYNTVTGEVESVPDMDNDYADFSEYEETMEKIDDSDDYVRLPSQQELHEYNIMERFAEEKDSNELMRALRGRKPFRTFKDTAIDLGLDKEYYAFRTEAYRDIAREWCRNNEIPFTEDGSAENPHNHESVLFGEERNGLQILGRRWKRPEQRRRSGRKREISGMSTISP